MLLLIPIAIIASSLPYEASRPLTEEGWLLDNMTDGSVHLLA
jgi:hypothetical protein